MAATGIDHDLPLGIERREVPDGVEVDFRIVTPGYFSIYGVPLRGREFTTEDREDGPLVVVVSQALVRAWFAGEAPIGRRLRIGRDGPWREIIGVSGDVRHRGLSQDPRHEAFVPLRQYPSYGTMNLMVRSEATIAAVAAAIRTALNTLDPEQPITGLTTVNDQLNGSTAVPRFHLLVFGSLAMLALLLSTAGVYGLIAYLAAQRRREYAIRLALGAPGPRILAGVLGEGVRLLGLGVVIGVAGAIVVTRALQSLLHEVGPAHPLALLGAVVMLMSVGLLACLGPAQRASRVDPASIPREE